MDTTEPDQLDTLDLTPSPRILEMIAEVDLKTWQCLAELVDNCFDELRKSKSEDATQEYRVDVSLPLPSQVCKSSEISISDNGRGMAVEQLRKALRAGSSGNQAHGNLGLFGMGFNVATARLGSVTTVKTGRKGSDHWTITTIDIDQMRQNDTYRVPISREYKDPSEHGTIITVSKLKTDIVNRLRSNQEIAQTKKHLGRIYSYILRDPVKNQFSGSDIIGGLGIPLYLNSNSVPPVLPCIWNPNRTVTRRGKEISTLQLVDFPLSDSFACMYCGFWNNAEPTACTECGSSDIQKRSRKISGWLGIQRYNHKNDFGINFIRLGRAISVQDKGIFDWEGEFGKEAEYPVELGDGRIVGEIHLDHAPVNFKKTDFDRENRAWTSMYEVVHGLAPLLPNKAKALGIERKDTPLVRLFDGFRRNDPGLNYLVPGNGSTAISERAREWGDSFHKGIPGYANDDKWYSAAKTHDDIVHGIATDTSVPSQADEAFFKEEGLSDLLDPSPAPIEYKDPASKAAPYPVPVQKQTVETLEERFDRYESSSTPLPDLQGNLRVGASTTELQAFITSEDLSEEGSPFYAVRIKNGRTYVYVNESCPLIVDFGWSASDVALLVASPKIMQIYGVKNDPFNFFVSIVEQFDSRKMSSSAIRHRGEKIVDSIRELFSPIVETDPSKYWKAIAPSARRDAEDVAVREAPYLAWDTTIQNGTYCQFLTPDAFVDLIKAYPEAFLDGAVFTTKFMSWNDPAVREEQVDRLCGLLLDLRRMITGVRANQPRELMRYVLSTDLLIAEIRL